MQLVDLALAAGMLRLPHPLLADDEDLQRVGRRVVERGDRASAPHTARPTKTSSVARSSATSNRQVFFVAPLRSALLPWRYLLAKKISRKKTSPA